jgi:hypothetical protein
VSLQGSFETIALADVMALLASSSKSGELRVVGGHVEGRLWMRDGLLVASKVGKAQGHVDALFELLRLTEGNFVFKDGVEPPPFDDAVPVAAVPVQPIVRQAEERLTEWRDIEAVVPSLEHRVRLIADLPAPEVTLSAEEWRLVMATALAGTVHGVLEELNLGMFDGCRGLRRLVDAGLVIVDSPRVRPSASDAGRSGRRSVGSNGSAAGDDGHEPAALELPSETVVAEPEVEPEPEPADHQSPAAQPVPSLESLVAAAAAAAAAASAPAPVAPVAPVAPMAIAAPTGEPSHLSIVRTLPVRQYEDPEPAGASDVGTAAAPPDREPEGDNINRGLLLKFLSSVRS